MKLLSYYSLFISVLILLTFGCKGQDKSDSENSDPVQDAGMSVRITSEQFNANNMRLDTLSFRSVTQAIAVSGRIDVPPQSVASLSAIHGGYIKDIPFLEGDAVRKGQALVTLENPEFIQIQQQYLETSEQLGYLKSEYERQETLIKENITSQKNFLKAESAYKSAVARSEGLRKQLLMLSISPKQVEAGSISSTARLYAPIDGKISEVHGTKGMYVSPTTEILEIINTDHIHLELNVFEKDILKLRKGQEIRFQLPETSDQTYLGEVYLIGTDIDPNRTIKVHGHLKDESGVQFLRGMFVEAEILVSGDEGLERSLTVPETALVEQEGHYYLLKLESRDDKGYSFLKEEVTPGKSSGGYVAITATDLKAKDQILVQGAYDAMPQ
ncbi:MAG: efflux RND transporter periplasmic adaptor subunit [Bacteroidia bacterium]|nr:efflux RND transporter periplasmic adaptor subunit [Bacteroidia bacterium]